MLFGGSAAERVNRFAVFVKLQYLYAVNGFIFVYNVFDKDLAVASFAGSDQNVSRGFAVDDLGAILCVGDKALGSRTYRPVSLPFSSTSFTM